MREAAGDARNTTAPTTSFSFPDPAQGNMSECPVVKVFVSQRRSRSIGPYESRRNGVDGDAVLRPFGCETAHQVIYGGLAHAIDCLAAKRHRTSLGAYAYYAASLLCNHLPGDRLGYQKCALDVDLQYLVHVCLSDALSKITGCDADVVHENINPSEGLNRLSDRSLDFTAFRNIQSEREGLFFPFLQFP